MSSKQKVLWQSCKAVCGTASLNWGNSSGPLATDKPSSVKRQANPKFIWKTNIAYQGDQSWAGHNHKVNKDKGTKSTAVICPELGAQPGSALTEISWPHDSHGLGQLLGPESV